MLEEQKINKARRKWQKQTEFLCTIKFRNSLPDPPLGPHFLEVPLDLDKYVEYRPTTLERDYKWKVILCYWILAGIFCSRMETVKGRPRSFEPLFEATTWTSRVKSKNETVMSSNCNGQKLLPSRIAHAAVSQAVRSCAMVTSLCGKPLTNLRRVRWTAL